MAVTQPDDVLTCSHPRHLWMLSCWLGWNPDRDGGRWETCDVPRPKAESIAAKAREALLSPSQVLQDALRERLGLGPDLSRATPLDPPLEDPPCAHPRKERTSYGLCRACGQQVNP